MSGALLLLVFAAGVLVTLVVLLPDWRRLMSGGRNLPVWSFLRRRHMVLDATDALEAKLRCQLCASQQECRHLLAAGAKDPVPGCPNLELLQERQPLARHEPRAAKEAH
jgi:hypothetical protein